FGDINGDGLRDAVIGVEIHERNADGTFGEALRLATYMVNPTLPIIADFNGDGLDDLVNHQFIDFYTMPFMAVYMGGGGTLQPPFRAYHPGYNHSFSIPMNRHVYAKGDFNSDGCADLAVAIQYDGVAIFDGYNCKQRVSRTAGNPPPIRVPWGGRLEAPAGLRRAPRRGCRRPAVARLPAPGPAARRRRVPVPGRRRLPRARHLRRRPRVCRAAAGPVRRQSPRPDRARPERARARGPARAGRRPRQQGDRRAPARVSEHGQDPRRQPVRQARRAPPHRGDRPCARARD